MRCFKVTDMSRADELRENARWHVELVMKTDEPVSREILKAIDDEMIQAELEADELDAQKNSRQLSDDVWDYV